MSSLVVEIIKISQDTKTSTYITEYQLDHLAQWISESGELKYISGEKGTVLSIKTLTTWIYNQSKGKNKILAIALVKNSDAQIMGLCTLTKTEEPMLGKYDIEICHLIVHKKYRRKKYASKIIKLLIHQAKEFGFLRILGRVHIDNNIGFTLLESLGWQKSGFYNGDENVVWYEYGIH